jgi:hypothetical protein
MDSLAYIQQVIGIVVIITAIIGGFRIDKNIKVT